jgi:hypothetical protein
VSGHRWLSVFVAGRWMRPRLGGYLLVPSRHVLSVGIEVHRRAGTSFPVETSPSSDVRVAPVMDLAGVTVDLSN